MIRIKNLHKSFGLQKVLNGLNLEVQDKEILVILGASGSGKSVLLKHIMGLLKPDSGEVLIDDQDMTKLEGSQLYQKLMDVGIIFQGGALFDSITVGENVAFYLREHGMRCGKTIKKSEISGFVKEALKKVGLDGIEKKMPSELSGGMKKRAAIARGIIYGPKYLCYDEPVTGLDPLTANSVAISIKEGHEALGGTTIVVSHDIVTTLQIADRIALIDKGKINIIDKPEEFMKCDHPTIQVFNKMIGGNVSLIRGSLYDCKST